MRNFVRNEKVKVSLKNVTYEARFHSLSRNSGYAYVTNERGENFQQVDLQSVQKQN